MTTLETIFLILLLVLMIGFIWIITEISDLKRQEKVAPSANPETLKLRLQAYERVSLLAERISLQNILSRTPNDGLSYRQMQRALIDAIKEEYEYNISQQVYVSNDMWNAVTKLKEQNIYIINQVAANISTQASGIDLNKRIIEYVMNNPKSQLQNLVLEALNFEAKELM
ncbi:MAG: hypothetical protein ABI123_10330 [Ginsengibacter sp.]|jgi:hypothetical protein